MMMMGGGMCNPMMMMNMGGGMCNPMMMNMGGGMCNPMMMNMMTNGQGPYSKGCGKGAGTRTSKEKMMWISGLGDKRSISKIELVQFFNEALPSRGCLSVELRTGGHAVAYFNPEANKNQVIAQLNGANFKEFTLQLGACT